jgi:micrococcal nuclease
MKKTILTLILFTLITIPVSAQDFYNVKYLNNYDGDTIKFDLGCNLPDLFRYIPLRLYGIDTPEIKSKNPIAIKAKDFVKNELTLANQINLLNCKEDKYYRIDCSVNYDGKDLTTELLNLGYGYPYYGKTKQK